MKRLSVCGVVTLATLVAVGEAYARAGGGDTWGGGGGGGRGGGGSGGGSVDLSFLIELFVRWCSFCYHYPHIGLPITAAVVLLLYFGRNWNSTAGTRAGIGTLATSYDRQHSDAGGGSFPGSAGRTHGRPRVDAAAAMTRVDPYFSLPVFLDFAQLLFVRFHQQRGKRAMDALRPYVAAEVLERTLAANAAGLTAVDQVLIGASTIAAVHVSTEARIEVRFKANLQEARADVRSTMYLEETWSFHRAADVPSKAPEDMTRLGCPACGAADEPAPDGRCPRCTVVVHDGRFQWFVAAIRADVRRRAENFSPAGGAEVGTDLPTVLAPTLREDMRAFSARHADFSWEAFRDHAELAFLTIQKAWSEQRWEEARALETDHLFQVHRFWLERYREAGLVNRLDDVAVRRITPVKVSLDAFFEAITVRIFASGFDSTVDAGGRIVAGSRTERRSFSEYWTFLRRIGHTGTDQAVRGQCPSCGAGLKINMAGVCEYCTSKIVTGDFGWVLTAIDQDEEYQG